MKLTEKNVVLNFSGTTKKEVFKEIAKIGVDLGCAQDNSIIEKGLWAREDHGSTGMEFGFAIPHAKSKGIIKPSIVVLKTKSKIIDYESFDGSDITNCISLLIPDGEASTTHLKLLSKIAVKLLDEKFRKDVTKAKTQKEVANVINKAF